jgi:hypothetical protein
MSSPRSAAVKPARPKAAARTAAKPAVKPVPKPSSKAAGKPGNGGTMSGEATRLAAEIERAVAKGELDTLSPQALQALMSAVCKSYATRVEAGEQILPLAQRSTVSPTEVMVTASGLLRAANLAVFELGMWQSWTGR